MNIRDTGVNKKYKDAKAFIKWYDDEFKKYMQPKDPAEAGLWDIRNTWAGLYLSGVKFQNLLNAIKRKYHKRVFENGTWIFESKYRKGKIIHKK